MEMTIAKQVDVRSNMKQFFDLACSGVAVFIPRKENHNVVILSEQEYRQLERARRNTEYLRMLDKSEKQLKEGRTVVKTMAELEDMDRRS